MVINRRIELLNLSISRAMGEAISLRAEPLLSHTTHLCFPVTLSGPAFATLRSHSECA